MPKGIGIESTPEEAREIYNLRVGGMSPKDVSEVLGIKVARVFTVLRKYRKMFPALKNPNRVITKEEYQEAFRLHVEENVSWIQIGKKLKADPRRFSKAFRKKFGNYEADRTNYMNRFSYSSKGFGWRFQRIVELRNSGKTDRFISELMDISIHQVRHYIKRGKNQQNPVFIPEVHEW